MIEDLNWNHNDHYHRLLLRALPDDAKRALDVGCGRGAFARDLARRGLSVDALDRSPEMLAAARAASAGYPGIRYVQADLLETDLEHEAYDFVSSIASIHHMPFDAAFERLTDALAPGGVLAILGLYRATTWIDYPLMGLPFFPNIVMRGGYRVARAVTRRPEPDTTDMPVLDARMGLGEIRRAASVQKGDCTIRRRVFWRYSLVYRKPDLVT